MINVIDFHTHCFPNDIATHAINVLSKMSGVKPYLDGTVDSLLLSMDNSGISHSVVLSIATKSSQSEKITEWSNNIKSDLIYPFGSIHPDNSDIKGTISKIKELGIKGIKLHPEFQNFNINTKELYRIYEIIFENDLILVLHSGEDLSFIPPYKCKPKDLAKLVKNFKSGKIIAAHMGGFRCWNDVERFLVGEDLYFDTSYALNYMKEDQFRRIMKNHGYNKILFGTDSPWVDQQNDLKKFLDLNLGKDIEEKILYTNGCNLLSI